MSRCLVVYFSQGGTTRRIAEAVASGLRAQRHDVELHDLNDGPAPDPRSYDVLGVGSPAHYYRPATVVSEYLERLPALSGRRVFTFILHAAYVGDAGNFVRRALRQKAGEELGYARFRGEGRFLGYLKHGYRFSPDEPKPDAISRAELFGGELAARLAGQAHVVERDDARTPLIYRLERFLTNRFFVRHVYRRLFRVDRSACNACGVCVKCCPTGNVSLGGDGALRWGRSCTLCFSCEARCPREAIASPVTWFLFWPFMVYNTRAAAADPAIEHARVAGARAR